jgi:hypothetical protein
MLRSLEKLLLYTVVIVMAWHGAIMRLQIDDLQQAQATELRAIWYLLQNDKGNYQVQSL